MTHEYVIATVGELVCRLDRYGNKFGSYSLSIGCDEEGNYTGMFNFGSEAPDSPMVAGSSLGAGDYLIDVLKEMVAECNT